MSPHEATARGLLAEALGVAPDAIAPDAAMDREPGWTSLSHMHLVVALEAHLGVTLDAGSVLELTSLRRITALLERHGGGH